MKKPVDPPGSFVSWLGPSLVVSGLLTGPSAGYHLKDPAGCLEDSGGEEEEDESWGIVVPPVSPSETIAHDEPLLATQQVAPDKRRVGAGSIIGMSPEDSAPGQRALALDKELASLRAELVQIREAWTSEQREIGELRGRLRELERKFDDLLAAQDFDAEEVPVDPHARWIEQNLDQLRQYPDMFIALDADRGILAHATEQGEFAAKLDRLTPEENDRVMLFHTSMYLRG